MIRMDKTTMNAELVIGDTGSFSIIPKINGEAYLSDGDEVVLTVKRIRDGQVVLEKKYTKFINHKAEIVIEHKDTLNLEKGNYIYDLKVIRKDGTVDTIIPNNPSANLTLKEGVKSWI